MANKMLIDAAHPEETRVVVVRGNRVEEFDFEAANRKQLRGNIYLAKVTRVEPSLQAAFVEYGGNRHGFLAFSEIHPDYYQIPIADRQALLEAEASEREQDDTNEPEEKPKRRRRTRAAKNESKADTVASDVAEEPAGAEAEATTTDNDAAQQPQAAEVASADDVPAGEVAEAEAAATDGENDAAADDAQDSESSRDDAEASAKSAADDDVADDDADGDEDGDDVESVGAEDAMEEVPERRHAPRRQYKIQEVIKRRQVILVQVVKEERGNKGAALTTYLSLAGRYSVLMPNTARGGGISRKITQPTDRKRLKKIASELDVPEGMGVILRTAGASRTKAEIKRDFEYLMRLWENVRELTLKSSAPSLVYEEGSLIKRSIRDLYNKDINQVLVAGDEGYKEAKGFMRMLMPSHAKNVQPYRDPSPLFIRSGVEPQLDAMFSPQVTLKSGGYIVINQTEALVSIDVNSGKSTKEHNIEDTALQTNLEAAEEVSRQLRLRDLAGLVVIDFIDMEENKNNRTVERKLKECLKSDRARIQVGRISHFGLLEMSRQRLRTGVLESSTTPCPHCNGTGMIRSVESVALHVLRSIEDNLLKGATHNLVIRTTTSVALYILNQKRAHLSDLETRFAVEIAVHADEMVNGQHYVLERADPVDRSRFPAPALVVQPDTIDPADEFDAQPDVPEEAEATQEESERDGDRDRKRRRRRKRRRGSENGDAAQDTQSASDDETQEDRQSAASSEDGDGEDEPRRKRRRGRRGGRRGRRGAEETDLQSADAGDEAEQPGPEKTEQMVDGGSAQDQSTAGDDARSAAPADTPEESTAAPVGSDPVETAVAVEAVDLGTPASDEVEAPSPDEPAAAAETQDSDAEPELVAAGPSQDQDRGAQDAEDGDLPAAPAEPVVTSEPASTEAGAEEKPKPKRGGWWQRRSFF
ncbi:MAG: Rne/Rng family ribonuclease [Roseibium sp.]|nr:Rne/Rng family ribonuclease [Roseibium sp.]